MATPNPSWSGNAPTLDSSVLAQLSVTEAPLASEVPTPTSPQSPSMGTPTPCRGVQLVEGSTPHLTEETASLLRRRLLTAVLILLAGNIVFAIVGITWRDTSIADHPELKTIEKILEHFHVELGILLAVMAYVLYRPKPISLRRLRVYEAIIFGAIAGYFLLRQSYDNLHEAIVHVVLPGRESRWLLLMFIYATFIPNPPRRAAIVMALFTAAPVVSLAWQEYRCTEVAKAIDFAHYSRLMLPLILAGVAGIIEARMIGNLREEAFTAKQLGQYKLCRKLGAGGMGEVYLAEHQMLKRPCAVKVIRPEQAGDPRALARFEREVKATSRLSHWNTVEIFDYGRTADGTFYYVMEYLPGLSLSELVERYGPLAPERAIYLLEQVCDGLSEAHAMGLIHRDLKPGNVIAAQRGGQFDVAKVVDFGLVKPLAGACDDEEENSLHLTQEGTIRGSPLFMAPEQAIGDQEPDARSDVYALGGVAYFLLTGHAPFEYSNAVKVLVAHAQEAPKPMAQWGVNVPADLERVVLQCLAKRPEDRFASVADLRDALANCSLAGAWTRESARRWWSDRPAATPPMCEENDASQASSRGASSHAMPFDQTAHSCA